MQKSFIKVFHWEDGGKVWLSKEEFEKFEYSEDDVVEIKNGYYGIESYEHKPYDVKCESGCDFIGILSDWYEKENLMDKIVFEGQVNDEFVSVWAYGSDDYCDTVLICSKDIWKSYGFPGKRYSFERGGIHKENIIGSYVLESVCSESSDKIADIIDRCNKEKIPYGVNPETTIVFEEIFDK